MIIDEEEMEAKLLNKNQTYKNSLVSFKTGAR